VEAFGAKLTADAGEQAAYLTVLFNLVVPTLLSLLMRPHLRFLERFWPQSKQEWLSQAESIHAYVGNQPETAVVLADRERMRLMKRLPAYLDTLRVERERSGNPGAASLHDAFGPISERVLEFLLGMLQSDVELRTSARLLSLQNRQALLAAIEEDIFGLCQILRGRTDKGKAGQLGLNVVECLDTLLLTVIASADTGDSDERELLLVLTADRGELMERIRKTYLSMEGSLSLDDRSLILYVIHLFERTAWCIGQYGRLLPRGATQ
jgi:phosphate:Na+ symporter